MTDENTTPVSFFEKIKNQLLASTIEVRERLANLIATIRQLF